MKLTKKTYLTSETDKLIDRNFNELSKSRAAVNVDTFFQTYKEIFFRIPKTGTLSHTALFNRSGEYLQNVELSSDKIIRDLRNNIQSLNQQIADLEAEKNKLELDNKNKEQEIILLKQR